jgi:hypothetical protein
MHQCNSRYEHKANYKRHKAGYTLRLGIFPTHLSVLVVCFLSVLVVCFLSVLVS